MNDDVTQRILSRTTLSEFQQFSIVVLLVDDQAIIAETVRRMLQDECDIILYYCSDPLKAIELANEIRPTVILQDLVMPDIDGLTLVKYIRANPSTRDVPLIVLSSKEEPKIKAEAFALGANDYMVKLPDKIELVARIRYHSSAYIRLLERNQAFRRIEESQKILNAELAEAAAYVSSLLPAPLQGEVSASWRFFPSTQLGGDSFGYQWLDENHFAFFLLDVCGHGVGAALLSITVMNVIRSENLPNTNFKDPKKVLEILNESFLMENHHDMFFTMWYGVYDKLQRKIVYSTAGHPPAILITMDSENKKQQIQLKTAGLALGAFSGSKFENDSHAIKQGDILYLFSDGVYEIEKKDGTVMQLQEFLEVLLLPSLPSEENVDKIVSFSKGVNGPGTFADDFSILELTFN